MLYRKCVFFVCEKPDLDFDFFTAPKVQFISPASIISIEVSV